MKINDRVYGKDEKGKPIEGFVNKLIENDKVEIRNIMNSKNEVYLKTELKVII